MAFTIQNIWLMILTVILSYLFYVVTVQQRNEIEQLQKKTQLHHNLWTQWFEYESKRRGQVQVRTPRHVQANGGEDEELLQIDFWREWIQRALPPGCEDDEFHRKWLLEMDSYFWNRLSQEKNQVNLNCDRVGEDGLCEVFLQYLEKKLPQFNFTILNETKVVAKSQMILNVVDSSEGVKQLSSQNPNNRIVAFIGDCSLPRSIEKETNDLAIVRFSKAKGEINSCDETSVPSLSSFVWKKGEE